MRQFMNNTEVIPALAVILLLLFAMFDPRISAGLAFVFLIVNWVITRFMKRNWI